MQLPRKVSAVMADDVRRVARTYLRAESATIGWMMPGDPPSARPGAGLPKAAADRNGPQAPGQPVTEPELRHLRSGLPAVVQRSSLSDSVTVEVLVAGTAKDGTRPTDLPGLDAIVRSGRPGDLGALLSAAIASSHAGGARQARSGDPATRLEQLIQSNTVGDQPAAPAPLAVIVTGNVEPQRAFDLLDHHLGVIPQGKLATGASLRTGTGTIRERIAEPLPQGALGYVVAGPAPGTREALAWKMLLYVLTHDYSGRLGLSAIRDRGLVYDIESELRTDGRRSWAVISTGVDPGKADAMEAELRRQLALLATEPPSPVELAAARNHLLGRDLSAAQSNEELAARIARQLIERGALRSHEQLKAALESISAADVAAAVPAFAAGTIIRVDVGPAR